MLNLKDMKIGKRLIVSFVIVLIITTLGSLSGAALLQYSDRQYSFALERYGFAQGDLGLLLQSMTECKVLTRNLVEAENEADINTIFSSLETESENTNTYLSRVETTLDTTKEKDLFAQVTQNLDSYHTIKNNILSHMENKQPDQALQLYNTQGEPSLESCIKAAGELMDLYKETGTQLSSKLSTQSTVIFIAILLIIAFSITVSMILARKISRGISEPIKKMVEVAREISRGNLQIEVNVDAKDEIGELGNAFQNTIKQLNTYVNDITDVLKEIGDGNLNVSSRVEYQGAFIVIKETTDLILRNLNSTLGDIKDVSEMVAGGSQQIASSGQSLSEGAMEQSSAVQELDATINEVAEQVDQNAQNSKNAQVKAVDVAAEVEKSNEKMQEMIAAMNAINEASSQIELIMKTIEEIASQTNLLSLNAAIEAARAGEAGKGFAVVADEIRELASQSGEAAKNTNTLIDTTVRAVGHGSKIADETARALDSVVTGVKGVTHDIETITSASEKQAASIEEIKMAVGQIAGVIENNSAAAEESAASSEELSSQSVHLNSLIHKFTLAE